MPEKTIKLEGLKEKIPHKWRIQSYSKWKPQATCVAYVDARDVMDLLDNVCAPENWQDDYKTIDGKLFAGIGIRFNGDWIWKWDTGTESNIEKEKGQVSDSFKRAAVKWGIGRFLYSLDVKYLKTDGKKGEKDGVDKFNIAIKKYPNVIDDKGKNVWDITKHINKSGNKLNAPPAEKESPKAEEEKPISASQKKTLYEYVEKKYKDNDEDIKIHKQDVDKLTYEKAYNFIGGLK